MKIDENKRDAAALVARHELMILQTGYRNKIVGYGSSLGLTGYAENLPDGRVKVVAEGEERKLAILKEIAEIKNTLARMQGAARSIIVTRYYRYLI